MIKLTEDEKVILRNIDKRYRWIARDGDGNLFIYREKPIQIITKWVSSEALGFPSELTAFSHLFQFIKWEDKEPYLIEDLLKEELPKNFEKLSEE